MTILNDSTAEGGGSRATRTLAPQAVGNPSPENGPPVFPFAYAVFSLPFVIAWMFLYLRSTRLRPSMLGTSAFMGLAGPIGEFWHGRDYWHPDYLVSLSIGSWRFGLEDYVLTFAMAGTVMAIYETWAVRLGWSPLPRLSFKAMVRLDMWGNFGIVSMFLFTSLLRLNSIYAIVLSLLISSAVIGAIRPAGMLHAACIAVVFAAAYWLLFAFFFMPLFPGILENWWNLDALWKIRIAGVPLEEPLWAFCVALMVGPLIRLSSE
jgi:hypothetical protein